MAADIETLIRQALARQNGFDPMVRAKIYQSSRNALAKMIANSGAVPLEIINSRNRSLEQTISKIEQEFTSEMPKPSTGGRQPTSDPDLNDPSGSISVPQSLEPQTSPQQPYPQDNPVDPTVYSDNEPDNSSIPHPQFPEPNVPDSLNPETPIATSQGGQNPDSSSNVAPPAAEPRSQERSTFDPPYAGQSPEYSRPMRKPFRYFIWIIGIVILAIAGWVAYTVTVDYLKNQNSNQSSEQTTPNSNNGESLDFITILEPAEPSALITGGNGFAKILTDTSKPAIRVVSVRKPDTPEIQAGPMLLKLAPGVLKSIAGKKTTVEILAKSGDSGPATFTIFCDFGKLGECGRKRFRIGLQPEAVVFSILISENVTEDQKAFLAISTDVTSAAALTGKGSQIDIIYARLKVGK
ncbi:MAG: hypothetical protein GY761_16615 [Hyphomicrobiales bacterium]|nr:hypothetical protein [Hyphomicrobiales bacterium]